MNSNVEKMLKEKTWFLGTYDAEPNVVPVLFKNVTPDGKLLVGDVFLATTLQNIKANGKIAVSICDEYTVRHKTIYEPIYIMLRNVIGISEH